MIRSRSKKAVVKGQRFAQFVGGPICGLSYERKTADKFPPRFDISVEGVVYSYVGRVSAGLAIYRHIGPVALEGVK